MKALQEYTAASVSKIQSHVLLLVQNIMFKDFVVHRQGSVVVDTEEENKKSGSDDDVVMF